MAMMTPETYERRKAIDAAIAQSNSKPELIGHLERAGAGDVAESIEGKALIAARSPWGVIIFYIIGVLLGKYGIALSPEHTQILAGAFVLVGGYVMRIITHAPITGIVNPQSV